MRDAPNTPLPAGYRLQDYEIRKTLSSGGFSFVYLARDNQRRIVAIKEYLPNGLAIRTSGYTVSVRAAENDASFKHGMKCFFEEGRALATINHHNIVRVTNFFRANGTVYMVMQYERGKLLQDYILDQVEPVSEIFMRRVFGELLNGLREVHTHKIMHLDIKPANIYIRIDGSPVLLDFGSARQTLSGLHSNLQPSYTPGFAAPEQYNHRELLGPWSDIYSIGAAMYACVTRSAPMPADQRLQKDRMPSAEKFGKDYYSKDLLQIIDRCMDLNHLKRPQSVYVLQKALLENTPIPDDNANLISRIKAFMRG